MKSFIIIGIITAITILISSCDQKKDTVKLCEEFYLLNQGKNFEGLYDVLLGTSRVKAVYDDSVNQYYYSFPIIAVYDFKSEDFITIPVFKKGANFAEKDSVFKKFDQNTRAFLSERLKVVSEKELLGAYIQYVDSIYAKYYNIKTPKWHSSKNVIVEGHPRTGKFITFTLKMPKKVCKCYFIDQPESLNEYWSKYFRTLNRLEGSNWYYEVQENSED